MNSAMVAPTVALSAAYLNPTKHCGSAAGRRTFQNTLSGSAPVERQNRTSSSGSEPKARMAFNTIGKKHTRKTMITFGSSPNPSQEMNKGANAILGTISTLTKNG